MEDILTFAKLLFKNYNNDKERWYNNIRRNTYFNIYKVINEDFTHVLNYFKTFNFTNDDEYQLVYAHLQWVKDIISLKDIALQLAQMIEQLKYLIRKTTLIPIL